MDAVIRFRLGTVNGPSNNTCASNLDKRSHLNDQHYVPYRTDDQKDRKRLSWETGEKPASCPPFQMLDLLLVNRQTRRFRELVYPFHGIVMSTPKGRDA